MMHATTITEKSDRIAAWRCACGAGDTVRTTNAAVTARFDAMVHRKLAEARGVTP